MPPTRLVAALLGWLPAAAPAAVGVVGVEGELLENVREHLSDAPACEAEPDEVDRYVDSLPDRLRSALDAFGYYSAQTRIEQAPPEDGCWQVTVEIAPGSPVRVREAAVRLTGSAGEDAAMRTLVAAFPLAVGDPLRHGPYQLFKDQVEVLARQRGYLDSRFIEQRIDVHVDEGIADIVLVFESGPRYRFGDVRIETDALSDDVMRSFLGFDEGDPYDAELIARLQRDLAASQYFTRVNVAAELDAAANRRVPIRIDALADRAVSYTAGGGYSTDDGPRLRVSYRNDRRNRSGHQLDAEGLLAQTRQSATFEYRIPAGNPQRDWRSFRAGIAREDIDAGISAAARLSVRRTRVGDLFTVTRFADVLLERDEIASGTFTSQMLIPGIAWARSYRDDFARPREGHRVSLMLTAGIGSEVSLLQLDLHGKWVTATPWDARVLVRGRIGATLEDGDFVDVPLSMRFFAGGDSSVRGYDYQSLGPRNPLGQLIGGNRLVEASVEYEHPVLESWSIAVFVDSGNAFLDSGLEPRTGAGVGARWFSPIGPVRLDVAWPLDGFERTPELHLSLGPDL